MVDRFMSHSFLRKKNHYKDCSPLETISVIRNILSELGIATQEVMWRSFKDLCFAVSIEESTFPPSLWPLRTNGKGVSKELALASAHAEFIERLQNVCFPGFLVQRYGLMVKELRAIDSVSMELHKIASISNDACKSLFSLKELKDWRDSRLICIPFYEAIEHETYYLPEEILYWRCISNGLCAGNTPEEALVQGICEIFERYAARELYLNNHSFPTIPLSDLVGLECYDIVQKICDLGYQIEVKDCTLGGIFPIVGVLFIDKPKSQYHFHIGSHPLLDVAVQRCLTETIQGIHEPIAGGNGLGGIMGPIVWRERIRRDTNPMRWKQNRLRSFYSHYRTGESEYPPSLLLSKGHSEHNKAFLKKFDSNQKALISLLRLIHNNGLKLFVRDVSFLGFPSFRLYIPGITEIFPASDDDNLLEIVFKLLPQIRKTLLSLPNSSCDDIMACALSIERMLENPRFPRNEFSIRWNLNLSPSADFARFSNTDYLLALLFLRCAEYEKAFEYLEKYLLIQQLIRGSDGVDRAEYYWCALGYIGFKAEGVEEAEIERSLSELFGDLLAKQVMCDFGNPSEAFKGMTLPQCGACSSCSASHDCRYKDWEQLVTVLSKRMRENPIDQRKSLLWLSGLK